jgi:hypothetical protein
MMRNQPGIVRGAWALVALTLLIPFVGAAALVLGIVAAAKGHAMHGVLIIVASVVVAAFSYGVWAGLTA